MNDFTKFEVGEIFPVPGCIPHREGAAMELWETGPVVIIQMPGLRREERQAFKKGFKRYSYLESPTDPPIAVWVFDFSNPHGPIDPVFDARRVQSELINSYIDTQDGIKNALTFYLLDGETLRGMKMVGLDPQAVKLFHGTIRKQLAMNYDRADYDAALGQLFTRSTLELYQMGRVFKHRP